MQGKTWLTAIFCVVRCILYPGTQVVIASGVKKQAIEVIEKIETMLNEGNPNLKREISEYSTNTNDSFMYFANGSSIKVVASTDNARGKRAQVLIIDEFRLVEEEIVDTVLSKFTANPRQPGFVNNPKYKKNLSKYLERNKELYLSSAYYKSHWSWTRLLSFVEQMVEGKEYFVCSLPYQISVMENLYEIGQAKDKMSEKSFDPVAWSMEMDALFYGENSNAFFSHQDILKVRDIQYPLYPKEFYDKVKIPKLKYTPPDSGEITLIACDIAVASGNENDNTVFSVLRLTPTTKGFERKVIYIETMNGGHTVIQANRIKQLFYDFDCDYAVLDTKGVGYGVYDQLVLNSFDKERGTEYEAWSCINDEEMANRCTVANAPKVIYSIKANVKLNSTIAFSLRDKIRRGKIKFLIDGNDARQNLMTIKGFNRLSIEQQVEVLIPYEQTNSLINEMLNLETVIVSNEVTLRETGSMRKDRYSSVAYGNYVADILENDYLATINNQKDGWGEFAGLW